ncbi:phosphoribosyltransferase-like protein [Mycotypha africana]|uniref:phosphoribosyltransferase-like protein n=1 Tax=Mycotypha africana TaxID=64632 RepID=UPI002301653D|nr:phosphoribosyltransferase-like protein [Mycotypha africana]KAI8967628.1 phosphoribosyltransferase-like protein [Mycotypha africana]
MPHQKLHISYNQIHEAIRQSVERFHINEEFKPDLMIAIGGGGFIPARILRTFLKKTEKGKNIPIQAIGLSLYEDIITSTGEDENGAVEKPGTTVQKTQWLNFGASHSEISLLGRRILIVDEVDDTRTTLAYAVEELRKDIEAEEIRRGMKPGESNTVLGIYVLHNKLKEKKRDLPEEIKKNYFAAVEMPDQWLVYPWDAIDIETHTEHANKHN